MGPQGYVRVSKLVDGALFLYLQLNGTCLTSNSPAMQSPFSLVDQTKGFDKPERKNEASTDHAARMESGRGASTSLRDGGAPEGSPTYRQADGRHMAFTKALNGLFT